MSDRFFRIYATLIITRPQTRPQVKIPLPGRVNDVVVWSSFRAMSRFT